MPEGGERDGADGEVEGTGEGDDPENDDGTPEEADDEAQAGLGDFV